jgi:quercetin dioxygenase-like cupin family protein
MANLNQRPATFPGFLALNGRLIAQLRGEDVRSSEGELFAVPRGVAPRAVAPEEANLMLIEPRGEPNNGDPVTAAPKEII